MSDAFVLLMPALNAIVRSFAFLGQQPQNAVSAARCRRHARGNEVDTLAYPEFVHGKSLLSPDAGPGREATLYPHWPPAGWKFDRHLAILSQPYAIVV